MLFALCLLIHGLATSAAGEIVHLPLVDGEHQRLDFDDRAEAIRAQIPLENLPLNPLEPQEPSPFGTRLAQLPQQPDWVNPANVSPQQAAPRPTGRRVQIRPRGSQPLGLDSRERVNERVTVINSPTQINILGQAEGIVELGADRIVIWTDKNIMNIRDFGIGDAPVEIYLEGNILFRQAGHQFRAERMYYDAKSQNAVILEADMLVDAPGNLGKFRAKTDVLSMLSPFQFQANNAAITTSRLGVPRYWIQSDSLTLDTGGTALINEFADQWDGEGGQMVMPERLQVTSQNSALYLGGIPVFRWPSFTTDLTRNPSLYLDRVRVGNDSVFGTQVITRWNMFQLLGISPDTDTDWTANLDWLSDRGIGFGTDIDYERDTLFGRTAKTNGYLHSWFINDDGLDNLGADRRELAPEEDFRGRIYGQHRSMTPSGYELLGEAGWISDRNFLEQFYEEEWDLDKDQETRLQLKRYLDDSSWSIAGNWRINDFVTQTEWLPRADHYTLGRSLFGNRLTWYEHSQIGYARIQSADAPQDPADKFDPIALDVEAEGVRAVTRQEIDMPLQLGGLRVVPYALGEIAYWQEDINGDDLTRFLGQAGVRASLPFWRADPTIRNELFNLNGLAHKIVLHSEFLWADASENSDQLPLYDNLDDNSVEFFRRRFLSDTFAGNAAIPLKFDARNFAFRNGIQRFVTSPTTEIADDLMMLQLGLRQRLQTKRGVPGQQRIVDWFTFDIESHFFPRADRDNFGQEIGPLLYDMRWHVGDRTTMISDGYFDFFGNGLRTASLGLAISRPTRLQHYFGFRSITGPIDSNVFTSSVSARISPKWIWNYGSSIDLSDTGNIGQSASIVRVGESFLVSVGAHYDASRNNLGFGVNIVPRAFSQLSKIGRVGNYPIAPVSQSGLE